MERGNSSSAYLSSHEPGVRVGILNAERLHLYFPVDYIAGDELRLNGNVSVSPEGKKIRIEYDGTHRMVDDGVLLSPAAGDPRPFTIRNVTIGLRFHWERGEDQQFTGSLRIVHENEKLTAINVVSIEEYLRSVISSEMSPACNFQLLKAHAIISRGWLIAQIDKKEHLKDSQKIYSSFIENENEMIRWYDREDHLLYDVCADDHCQRYQGVTKAYGEDVNAAVRETRGHVLVYNDVICDARYSKSCGGISENFENVWEPVIHPYLTSITDNAEKPSGFELDLTVEENARRWIRETPPAFCNTSDTAILKQVLTDFDRETVDFFRWNVRYTQEEISSLIAEKSGMDFGHIRDLIPVERGRSGRLVRLKIAGTKITRIIGKELEIRRLLSPSHLYSAAFVVDKTETVNDLPGEFILTGAGWGHGVGLCQIGAAVMGTKGYSTDEILQHYFPGTKLKRLY